MNGHALTRRRFLKITAALGGSALIGGARADGSGTFVWSGTSMGADAKLSIAGGDRAEARRLVALTLGEIDRLERCFSLYRRESELVRLNATGRLDAPSIDFRILLARALAYWRGTEGAFNPAVQPLWTLLAAHFGRSGNGADPDPRAVERARALADPGRVSLTASRVAIAPGMGLTFNGIAQGYVTDRVSELLLAQGCHDVLVQLGEIRALPGKPWDVRIAPAGTLLSLENAALATSAPDGTRLSADGRWHHLLDARTGRSAHGVASVTVKAAHATQADALSTALAVAVADEQARRRIAARYPDAGIVLRRRHGAPEMLGRPL